MNGSVEKLRMKVGLETPYRIYVRSLNLPNEKRINNYGYLIRNIITVQAGGENDRHINQTIEETMLGCDIPDGKTFLLAPNVYMINLSALFYMLIEKLAPPG